MITQAQLKEQIHYNPDTGEFVWIKGKRKGKKAGTRLLDGYLTIWVKGRTYKAHRLAWLYMTGEFPKEQTDHINLIKDDNRFANLREATRSQNRYNMRISIRSKNGLKGVRPHPRASTWRAYVCKEYIGTFPTKEEAHLAYCVAAQEKFGQYWRAA